LKKELPFILKNAPQMPRLIHQFLSQKMHAEQDAPLQASIDALIAAQQKQARWQKKLTLVIFALALLQAASLVFLLA
jgi:ubiquinone biosynthesis protein